MPNTVLTLENIKEEVEISLGGTDIEVELQEKDYEKVIKDAVRLYNRHRPRRGNAALAVTTAQKKYGPLAHPGLHGIMSVNFVENRTRSGVDAFDSLGRTMTQGLTTAGGDTFGSVEQQLVHIEQGRNITSSETEWKGAWEGLDYYLYVDISQSNLLCSYEYTWHVTPNDSVTTGMKFIDDADVEWVLDYVKARAKEIVALKRRKFGGVTNPEGSQDPIDASEMMQEAREDLERLKIEIESRRRPLPPVLG